MSDGVTESTSDESKAIMFNHYFQSVFNTPNPLPEPPSPSEDSSLQHIVFDKQEVYSALAQLDGSKAVGIHGISPKIRKYNALPLYKPFGHLFNLSLQSHQLPKEWKSHCIIPVYKSAYLPPMYRL